MLKELRIRNLAILPEMRLTFTEGLNVLTGAAAQNWDEAGDDTNLTQSDRTMTLGSGIPSQAVPIFQKEGVTLLIGGGGGATSVDPDIGLPRFRTYWNEEEGT